MLCLLRPPHTQHIVTFNYVELSYSEASRDGCHSPTSKDLVSAYEHAHWSAIIGGRAGYNFNGTVYPRKYDIIYLHVKKSPYTK